MGLEDIIEQCRKEALADEVTPPGLPRQMTQLAFSAYSNKVNDPAILNFKPRTNYATELPPHLKATWIAPDERTLSTPHSYNMNEEGTYYHGFPERDILLLDVFGLVPIPGYGLNLGISWSNSLGYQATTVTTYGAHLDPLTRNITAVISKETPVKGRLMTDTKDARIPLGSNGEVVREAGYTLEEIKNNPNLAFLQPDTWLRTEDYIHPKHILGWIVGDENQAQRVNEIMGLGIFAQRKIWFPNGRVYHSGPATDEIIPKNTILDTLLKSYGPAKGSAETAFHNNS